MSYITKIEKTNIKNDIERFTKEFQKQSFGKMNTKTRKLEKEYDLLSRLDKKLITNEEKQEIKYIKEKLDSLNKVKKRLNSSDFKLGNPVYVKDVGFGIITQLTVNAKTEKIKLRVEFLCAGYYWFCETECAPINTIGMAVFGK